MSHPETDDPTVTRLRAFGAQVTLHHADDGPERDRQIAWLTGGCEFALASRVLPRSGLCVDAGAGEGWFAVAFAAAFPAWTVLCLEPDADKAARLRRNVAANNLSNVVCLAAGLHPEATTPDPTAPSRDGLADWAARMETAAQARPFQRLHALGGRLAAVRADQLPDTRVEAPALPVGVLAALAPDLLHIDAPGCEAGIAAAVQSVPVGLILGRLHAHVPSHLWTPAPAAGPREHYLLYAGHALRRDYEDNFAHRTARLDVVVAMYNARDFIADCVDSVLADGNPDIRVLVVDDGSTDGGGDLVTERYAGETRVRLISKPNGGCASARNYGRAASDATHIAFIDADDLVDPALFTGLLDVARHTGAFVVEGEFDYLHMEEDGTTRREASYEAETFSTPGNHRLGPYDYDWRRGTDIAVGQPTIWRRVHRRDFLDRRKIHFPEHIRAFDDQIFQLLVAQHCGDLAHVRGQSYLYRQHPGQDIKQGDERHFYSFNMFRTVLLRALDEGWADIEPVVQSLLNTMTWSYGGLRPDLRDTYREAAVEFLALLHKTFGYVVTANRLDAVGIDGLAHLVERRIADLRHDPVNYGTLQQENWYWQPELIRMMRAARA